MERHLSSLHIVIPKKLKILFMKDGISLLKGMWLVLSMMLQLESNLLLNFVDLHLS